MWYGEDGEEVQGKFRAMAKTQCANRGFLFEKDVLCAGQRLRRSSRRRRGKYYDGELG
jgi:hypothetical protein